MAEAVAVAGFRVTGICSASLITAVKSGAYTNEETFLKAVKEEATTREERKQAKLAKKEEVKAQRAAEKEEKRAQKAAEKEARIEQKNEEKYIEIRDRLVAKAFETTWDEIKRRKERLGALQDAHNQVIGNDNPLGSSTNSLDITEGVYNGAIGTTNADRKSSNKTFAKGMLGVAGSVAGVFAPEIISKISLFATSLAGGPIFTVLGIVITAATLIHGFKKYLKRNKGNKSDEFAKGEALEKELEEYLGKIEAFSKAIDADKEMLKGKIKTLKRKELKAFLDSYLSEKIKTFGIEKEDLQTGEVGDVFEEFSEEAKKTEEKTEQEEQKKQLEEDRKNGDKKTDAPVALGG